MKKKNTRLVLALAFVSYFGCCASMCATDPSTGQLVPTPQTVQVAKDVQGAVNWAVPVAAGIISIVGNSQEKADMNMAAASVGELNAMAASAQGTGNAASITAANSALAESWAALNGVITAQPGATAKVAAIPAIVDTAKAAAAQAGAQPLPTGTPSPASN